MTDVLVIGAGGAGLVAALSARQSGADVILLSKTYPTRSQTCMAQGGINAALANAAEDSTALHAADTLRSAQKLADKDQVEKLCVGGVEALRWLDSIGVPFSRTPEGAIAQRTLGGASSPRACYAQDYTGLKILHTLYDQCHAHDIDIKNERFLLDLLVKNGRVCGALMFNIKTGETEIYRAKSIVLATGGYSRLYGAHSTNHTGSTGDGIAAALRVGARISDMEFVQFHPTALKNSAILISESARGAGGYLIDGEGRRFTDELASRDKVALAIIEEMQKGQEVFLDLRHLSEELIENELPQEKKLAMLYENIDMTTQPVPIKPAAHYTMGGIDVDQESSTTVLGLFAAGECANHKVHGANRLGGNSLLELIVFGEQAGKNAARFASENHFEKGCKIDGIDKLIESQIDAECKIDWQEKKEKLADLFYEKVGIKRSQSSLTEVLEHIDLLKAELPLMKAKDTNRIYNTELIDLLEFKNMVGIAESVVLSALRRTESRGAHFREDMPVQDDAFDINTVCYKENSEIRFV